MNGPAHYQAAERWPFKAEHPGARGEGETAVSCALTSVGHGLLAIAAALALFLPLDPGERLTAEEDAWHDVASEARETS